MGKKTLFSGVVAFAIPCILYYLVPRINKYKNMIAPLALSIYIFGILFLTLHRAQYDVSYINLKPFWSYRAFFRADVRWQIYMNIFLFIPYGYIVAYLVRNTRRYNDVQSKRSFKIVCTVTVISGIVFSTMIEISQYLLCRGLCEFDDVFNNTIGSALGVGCLIALEWIEHKMSI